MLESNLYIQNKYEEVLTVSIRSDLLPTPSKMKIGI